MGSIWGKCTELSESRRQAVMIGFTSFYSEMTFQNGSWCRTVHSFRINNSVFSMSSLITRPTSLKLHRMILDTDPHNCTVLDFAISGHVFKKWGQNTLGHFTTLYYWACYYGCTSFVLSRISACASFPGDTLSQAKERMATTFKMWPSTLKTLLGSRELSYLRHYRPYDEEMTQRSGRMLV